MKLTVLVENNTVMDKFYKGEPGLSFLIEADSKKILFDTGYSGVFVENAVKMGCDLLDINYIVLSHNHFDHTWGLSELIAYYADKDATGRDYITPELVTHPDTFKSRIVKGFKDIGPQFSKEKLAQHFPVVLSQTPVSLTDKLVYLGEIERKNDFEARKPLGRVITGDKIEDDYIREDSALVYDTGEGLVVITGCSHSGICNIVAKAKDVFNEERIIDIVGGFHLINPDEKQLQGTINCMKKINPTELHPCHCTDFYSKAEMAREFEVFEIGVGSRLEY